MVKRKADSPTPSRRSRLVEFLRTQKSKIVREHRVHAPPAWDPTYGNNEPSTETLEIVDFEALLDAIDEFHAEFDNKESQ